MPAALQCNFMSMRWYRELANYEYAMRVDEDVCVQRFETNPFAVMRERRLVYGYGLLTAERHYETVLTMPPWVRQFALREGLAPPAPHWDDLVYADRSPSRLPGQAIYFTNFFVSRVDWWAGEGVQRFLRAVRASGSVYTHRWGDAPIQTTALQLYAQEEAVARLPTAYLHASTMDEVRADGSSADGWADAAMLGHPLVRAYRSQLVRRGLRNTQQTPRRGVLRAGQRASPALARWPRASAALAQVRRGLLDAASSNSSCGPKTAPVAIDGGIGASAPADPAPPSARVRARMR